MPIQTSSRSPLASLPSLMSVFGEHPNMLKLEEERSSSLRSPYRPSDRHFDTNYQAQLPSRDHTSISAPESADSSPTTTISTLDSAMTEPSSSSSTDSPGAAMPLSAFSAKFAVSKAIDETGLETPSSPIVALPSYSRPQSPAKKARNTKNLSLNMSAATRPGSQAARPKTAIAVTTTASNPISSPMSPSFIVPPKPPKRRPSKLGLTITTPATLSERSQSIMLPATPSDSRPGTLRHFPSSPSLSLFSPTTAPAGGMQLPPLASQGHRGRFIRPMQLPTLAATSDSDSMRLSLRLDELQEEDIEEPLSHEAKKSPAYPCGPVCVYDPHVYLYLEPNEVEASQFDVVLNVAREVNNPFLLRKERRASEGTLDVTSDVRDLDIRDASANSYEKRPKNAPAEDEVGKDDKSSSTSPSTPKAQPSQPEYIHVPWDHNTNIVDDMLSLVKVIDDRVAQGKRVLVHCQCGVSRSASLIVAYGLYKNPDLTVQQAYDAVKQRSRWIGPNMNLIYQLSEFRGKLPQTSPSQITGRGSRRLGVPGRSNSVSHGAPSSRALTSREAPESAGAEPQSAPLPVDRDRTPVGSNRVPVPSPPQNSSSGDPGDVSPGPSSAPSGLSFIPMISSEHRKRSSWYAGSESNTTGVRNPSAPLASGIRDAAPKPEGRRQSQVHTQTQPKAQDATAYNESLELSRNSQFRALAPVFPGFSGNPSEYQRPFHEAVIGTSGLTPAMNGPFSPRAFEFTSNPFQRAFSGEASYSGYEDSGLKSPRMFGKDPRSPAHRGEAPITRNIFDVL